jgi:hypothetical protein
MCRFFTFNLPSIFGFRFWPPTLGRIHDYLFGLVVTSLECIVTLTSNNSNCFLDPICAVHFEVSGHFVASVFAYTCNSNLYSSKLWTLFSNEIFFLALDGQ